MPKSRSKRLRKKLRVNEFQELGFDVHFTLKQNLSQATQDAFFDAFVAEAIEKNGLIFGGSSDGGFITLAQRGSATEEHQKLVKQWLSSHASVSEIEISELVDAWNI